MSGRDVVRRPPAGRRRVTLADVAQEAGVSPGLASMALSGRPGPSAESAAKVLDVAERLGYKPDRVASLLARRRTGLIGVTMSPANPYHGDIVEAVLAHVHDRGFEVLLSPMSPRHDYREALESLLSSRCEALVLMNPQITPTELATLVAGTPTVCLGKKLELPRVDVVRTDDAAAVGLLVDHLVRLGHRRIVHVDGGEQDLAADRRHAFMDAMRMHRLTPVVVAGGETPEAGAIAAKRLAEHRDCTAVVAFNDLCAVGLIDELAARGVSVPADVSVTGFDDSWLARLSAVSLTTIDPSPLDQARIAVDLALDRMERPDARRISRIVEPHLVVRTSTARPA